AMEAAEQALASINQASLFDGDDSDMAPPPEYVKVAPWSDKQKLTEEKAALGFYLSGHMFNAYATEARKFARTKLASLEPSREPKLMAGVISALRTQMTQRGKIIIVTLDDGSATADVTVYNEVFDANKALFKEDEFLAVHGKVSEDRFSGGLRITAEKVMDIAACRIQYGKKITMSSSSPIDPVQIKSILSLYRSEGGAGLPFAMHYTQHGICCEIRWPNEWRISPADGMLQALLEQLGALHVDMEY
ncbi:MAG: OB-fold nucleic acid binding domain-containing protein, partial [Burkholderiaceae bacterium]